MKWDGNNRRDKILAVMMALHPRLGCRSPIREFGMPILRIIAEMAFSIENLMSEDFTDQVHFEKRWDVILRPDSLFSIDTKSGQGRIQGRAFLIPKKSFVDFNPIPGSFFYSVKVRWKIMVPSDFAQIVTGSTVEYENHFGEAKYGQMFALYQGWGALNGENHMGLYRPPFHEGQPNFCHKVWKKTAHNTDWKRSSDPLLPLPLAVGSVWDLHVFDDGVHSAFVAKEVGGSGFGALAATSWIRGSMIDGREQQIGKRISLYCREGHQNFGIISKIKIDKLFRPFPPAISDIPWMYDDGVGVQDWILNRFKNISLEATAFSSSTDDRHVYWNGWNSCKFRPASISLKFLRPRLIKGFLLVVDQLPDGKTTHEIFLDKEKVTKITNQHTSKGQIICHIFDSPRKGKIFQINTKKSPSWVAWFKVLLFE